MKKIYISILILCVTFSLTAQKTWTSKQDGNWSSNSTWNTSGGASGTPDKKLEDGHVIISGHTVVMTDNLKVDKNSTLTINNGGKLQMGNAGTPKADFKLEKDDSKFVINNGTYESYNIGSSNGANMEIKKGEIDWNNGQIYVGGNIDVNKDVDIIQIKDMCIMAAGNINYSEVGSANNRVIMDNVSHVSGLYGPGNIEIHKGYIHATNIKLNANWSSSHLKFNAANITGSIYSINAKDIQFTGNGGLSGNPSLAYYCEDDGNSTPNLNAFSNDPDENCRIAHTICGFAPPTANDDIGAGTYGNSVIIDVLDNDNPGDEPIDPTTVKIEDGNGQGLAKIVPGEGTWTVNTNTGEITFTPESGYSGNPTPIEYYVLDDIGNASNLATVTLTYSGGAVGPTANNDSGEGTYGNAVTVNVLNNDTQGDAPIDPETVKINGTTNAGDPLVVAGVGTWTVDPNTGEITFTPVSGFTENPTPISYSVLDDDGIESNLATVTLTYTGGAVGPTANDDAATTPINTSVVIDVLFNDDAGSSAIDPATLSFSSAQPDASVGAFTISSGVVTFIPASTYIGSATIDYEVCDFGGLCDEATITVTIIDGTSNLFPAAGFGTLAFEDLWPGKGDYDFNDLVIDYQFEIITTPINYVEKVTATFVIKAIGATLQNGFGFQLVSTTATIDAADLTVSGNSLTESIITENGNGTEANQAFPTIIVFDNAYNEMEHPGSGTGINTSENAPYVQPVTIIIDIVFTPNTYTYNDLDISNFNPFIFVNLNRTVEVHLPDYAPTNLADQSLFKTANDDSDAGTGKYYKTVNNLPWAININESFDYPREKQEIVRAYLKFAEWAETNGTTFDDWYKNLDGYRDDSFIYTVPSSK